MLWGHSRREVSIDQTGKPKLFVASRELFIDNYWIKNALPFWILGVPLLVSVISYTQMPGQRALVPPDRREERRNIVREPVIRSGDIAASRG